MNERVHFHFSLSCIGEGNGNPLQCSCLENPRDGGAWWSAVSGVAQSRTRLKRLSSSSSEKEDRLKSQMNSRKIGAWKKLGKREFLFFFQWWCVLFFNFSFCIGVYWINNVMIVSGKQWRDSAIYIHMYPFSPKLPSHLGCYVTLSRVPCAMQ